MENGLLQLLIMTLCFEILSDFKYLPYITRIFRSFKIRDHQSLTLLLVEGYNNAVLHADKKNPSLWIAIEIDTQKKFTKIRVIDQGKGFLLKPKAEKKNRWRTHGRGLMLISALATKYSYKKSGRRHIFEAVKKSYA